MAEHVHDFGADPRAVRIGSARMCGHPDCTTWGVRHKGRVAWEPPTAEETIGLIAHMIEATAIGQAMTIIHGRDRGLQRAREVGYPP